MNRQTRPELEVYIAWPRIAWVQTSLLVVPNVRVVRRVVFLQVLGVQNTRVKLVKRQAYGRANFDLLRKRILLRT